jgi:hypothetical protein
VSLALSRLGVDDGRVVQLEDTLLEQLPKRLGVKARLWFQLLCEYYDNPRLIPELILELLQETRELRTRLIEELARQHQVRAKDPAVRAQLVLQLLAASPPPELAVLDELMILCDEAIAAGDGLRGFSD